MKTLQARPTTYRGIEMRSRLEARFAAGLDSLDAKWTYEPRAFADSHAQYLPDFQVGYQTFIEVKPTVEHAIEALDKGDIIFASEPCATFAVASPDLGNFLMLRRGPGETIDPTVRGLATHTLGGWGVIDFGGGHRAVYVASLDSTLVADPATALLATARCIARGEMFLPFDWSWK